MIVIASREFLLHRPVRAPRNRPRYSVVVTAIALLAVMFSADGCSRSGPLSRKLVPVSGTITLDGKPLPDGFVSFVSPTEGSLESFPVKEGKFAGKAELGVRTVEIVAIRDVQVPAASNDGKSPPQASRVNYLPAKYSMNSPLRADVTEAGPNVFDFELSMR